MSVFKVDKMAEQLSMNRNLTIDLEPILQSVSVIVPTYREAESLPDLIARLEPLRNVFQEFEVLVVDDNSQDGTDQILKNLNVADWVRLMIRKSDRGLSASVIDGCRAAKYSCLVVMDADLSHPPEAIPKIIRKLCEPGVEFVVGSRYCEGGGIEERWSIPRRINSFLATSMARPFTDIKDPMSGFLAFRKADFEKIDVLNPIGYKIGLELIVKCRFKNVKEIPIFFEDRKKGESKLSLHEQVNYLRHIKRLADFKFGNFSFFFQFGLVGTIGLVTNVVLITVFNWMGIPIRVMIALAIYLGMIVTFLLNRFLTFNHGGRGHWPSEYIKFVAACSVGALVNYATTLLVIQWSPHFHRYPQIPALFGAVGGMGFNFFFSRYVVFKKNLVTVRKK